MKLRFIRKIHETGDVWSFVFEPVDKITWQAGQSIRLELPRPTWGYDERRFTISSAPYENDLQVTTRLSGSDFKHLLDKLEPGQEIDGHNIEGAFMWGDQRPKLCIAGGIGITPFRPLILQAAKNNSLDDVILLHRSTDKPSVFQSEFEKTAVHNSGLLYHQLSSRLDINTLEKLVPDWKSRDIYLSGSSEMVRVLSKMLLENGAYEQQIKYDVFTGKLS